VIAETWVINASPLILLGKLGRIDLLEQLAKQIMVPQAVLLEIAAGGAVDAGLGDTLAWARNRAVEDVLVPISISGWDLGAGESQVLAHCLLGRYRAVLDDGEARAAAKVHSLPMVGSLGVILRARKAGLISAARPLVEQLVESGSYLSTELIRQALIKVGE
jgi:predicted nucleic acid-binding protein